MIDAFLARPKVVAGQFLRAAVAWWLAELAGMVPAAFARMWGGPGQVAATLDLTGDMVFLVLQERGRAAPLSVALGDASAEARGRVSDLLRRRKSPDSVAIRLDPKQLFVTTLTLPRAAERSLEAVLRHQVERLLPLPAVQTSFAFRVLPHPAGATTLQIVVAVVKRTSIDRALALARSLGLAPRQVVAWINEAGPRPLIMWQADRSRAQTIARRRVCRGLELAAVVLALIAYGLHVHRLEQVRDGLLDAVSQARQQAVTTRALSQQVTQSADALSFLRTRRQEADQLGVLDTLTRLLPLDSWVSELRLRDRTVEIIGTSPRATDLITLIEGSQVFDRAQFRSPITLLPDGHAERFDLTFEVKVAKPQ
jgi:general secretion pathway protein L